MTKFSEMAAGLLAVTMALTPSIGFAKDNHPGKGRGHDKKAAVEAVHKSAVRADRSIVVANCPRDWPRRTRPAYRPARRPRGKCAC